MNEAKKSPYINKLGALAICKGKLVGRGFNKAKRHAASHKKYGHYFIHAEVAALLSCANTSTDTIFVVRLRRDGKLSMSKPCEKCQKFIRDCGVKRVIYLNWDGEFEEMKI